MAAKLILPHDAERDEWIEARRAGVTASEIPIVMGLVPGDWNSPFNLYYVKRGEIDPPPDNDVMRVGRWLEPYVLDEFAARHPEFHLTVGGLHAHPQRGWQMATFDGRLYDDVCRCGADGDPNPDIVCTCTVDFEEPVSALEAKTVPSWDDWGEEHTDDIPVHYKAQGLWQADVLGVPETVFAVLNRATGEYREYAVAHDPDECALMRAEAETFLKRLEVGDPPPVDAAAATTDALKALHPDLDKGQDVPIGTQLAQRYRSACRKAKAAEERKTHYTNRILAALGNAQYAMHDGEKVATRVVFDRKDVKTKKLREDHPDLVGDYVTTSTVNQLRPAKESK